MIKGDAKRQLSAIFLRGVATLFANRAVSIQNHYTFCKHDKFLRQHTMMAQKLDADIPNLADLDQPCGIYHVRKRIARNQACGLTPIKHLHPTRCSARKRIRAAQCRSARQNRQVNRAILSGLMATGVTLLRGCGVAVTVFFIMRIAHENPIAITPPDAMKDDEKRLNISPPLLPDRICYAAAL